MCESITILYHKKLFMLHFVSALIFEVDGDGRLPPHVKYKIRQNASLTQDTKTLHIPFWRRDTFGFNFLYYTVSIFTFTSIKHF